MNVAAIVRARLAPSFKLESTRPTYLVLVVMVNSAPAAATAVVTPRRVRNSGGEYAYLVSATLFSRGELSVPSPPWREFFDCVPVVNDGRYRGKYPRGWPLVLALGDLIREP